MDNKNRAAQLVLIRSDTIDRIIGAALLILLTRGMRAI